MRTSLTLAIKTTTEVKPVSSMHSSVRELFEYCRSNVSDRMILDHAPNDPGYPAYVSLWTTIRRTGIVPKEIEFDLSEVIGLTGWGHAEQESDAEGFRCFRRFTSSVAVMLVHSGNDCESVRPGNYLARDLILDLDASDSNHLKLLRPVFAETRALLAHEPWEGEFPFFTFGMMILAQMEQDWKVAAEAAAMLIDDDAAVRRHDGWRNHAERGQFLLGLSGYDQVHGDWRAFAGRLVNPTKDENTQLIIDSLAECWD
jgi:hypothetical protein